MSNTQRPGNVLFLTQFSILLAIEALFCFTPLGSIPFTPLIVATLAMIPVIITSLVMGPKAGTFMGFFAGLFSFLVWTLTPPNPLIAFVFTPVYPVAGADSGSLLSLVICFVPRILTGTVAGVLFPVLRRFFQKGESAAYAIAGVAASLFHTFGVVGGIWLFFGDVYAGVIGEAINIIARLTVLTNGIPEAILAGLSAVLIAQPIRKYIVKN